MSDVQLRLMDLRGLEVRCYPGHERVRMRREAWRLDESPNGTKRWFNRFEVSFSECANYRSVLVSAVDVYLDGWIATTIHLHGAPVMIGKGATLTFKAGDLGIILSPDAGALLDSERELIDWLSGPTAPPAGLPNHVTPG